MPIENESIRRAAPLPPGSTAADGEDAVLMLAVILVIETIRAAAASGG